MGIYDPRRLREAVDGHVNGNKIILDLCGGSGSWSAPYRAAGYDVRLVTLPKRDVRNYIPPLNVYGILAAPPCNEFSQAKGNKWDEAGHRCGMEIVQACLKIIWTCTYSGGLKFWCLENPLGRLSWFLGKPAGIFEHWQFGDNGYKPTCLWGDFIMPVPANPFKPVGALKVQDVHKGGRKGRAAERAITPPKFAQAFFESNR